MTVQKAKGGKKHRKHGKKAKWCERYKLSGRREVNKVKKIKRHLNRYPDDKLSQGVLEKLVAATK